MKGRLEIRVAPRHRWYHLGHAVISFSVVPVLLISAGFAGMNRIPIEVIIAWWLVAGAFAALWWAMEPR